jgi:hypothetical protein
MSNNHESSSTRDTNHRRLTSRRLAGLAAVAAASLVGCSSDNETTFVKPLPVTAAPAPETMPAIEAPVNTPNTTTTLSGSQYNQHIV